MGGCDNLLIYILSGGIPTTVKKDWQAQSEQRQKEIDCTVWNDDPEE